MNFNEKVIIMNMTAVQLVLRENQKKGQESTITLTNGRQFFVNPDDEINVLNDFLIISNRIAMNGATIACVEYEKRDERRIFRV